MTCLSPFYKAVYRFFTSCLSLFISCLSFFMTCLSPFHGLFIEFPPRGEHRRPPFWLSALGCRRSVSCHVFGEFWAHLSCIAQTLSFQTQARRGPGRRTWRWGRCPLCPASHVSTAVSRSFLAHFSLFFSPFFAYFFSVGARKPESANKWRKNGKRWARNGLGPAASGPQLCAKRDG